MAGAPRVQLCAKPPQLQITYGCINFPDRLLDVVFREDAQRVYDRTAAQNVAFLNRLAVSLLREDASPGSLKVRRKAAGWDVKYLAQLLGFPSN